MSTFNKTSTESIDDILGAFDSHNATNSLQLVSHIQDVSELINNAPDPRLYNLSYSSLTTLHSCPRKFELDKKNSTTVSTQDQETSITFSYGHIVGLGIQMILEGKSHEEFIWQAFLLWKAELFAENVKQNKSFASAIFAVEKFKSMLSQGFLQDYELVIYNGKPACELSFIITLPNGFKYRGFVDAVLQHKITKAVIVLECKTSSAVSINSATYKNSAQAVGYSIVLDAIFPELSSYKVIYLIYSTKQYQYETLEFTKTYVQRARWIRELVLDADLINTYIENDLFPMHGESCFSYFRECEYMNLCQMSTDRLVKPITQKEVDKMQEANEEYEIKISLDDLINSQLSKS